MSKKKASIGELIKSDMSRRVIGEEAKPPEKAELFPAEKTAKKPPEIKPAAVKEPPAAKDHVAVNKPQAVKEPVEVKEPPAENKSSAVKEPASRPTKGSAGLMVFIDDQAKSFGLTEEADLCNYYDFLRNQAARYTRGFDAGRRFHG